MESDSVSVERIIPSEAPPLSGRIYSLKLNAAVLVLFFALNFSSAVFQNQIIYQTCTGIFGYNQSVCALLGGSNSSKETEQIETEIQPYAAKVIMTRSFVESLLPALCGFFIGPWSDKFGRKPVLVVSCIGLFLGSTINAILTFLSTFYILNPWMYLLSAVPVALTGGFCALLTGLFSHIADITTVQQRPYKLAVIGAIISVGLMLGSLACGYVFTLTNATIVFVISSLLLLVTAIYLVIFIEESLKTDQLDPTSKIRGLFKWALVEDLFGTCFERRPNYERAIIWCVMTCMGLGIFVLDGSSNVFFLFIREKFAWTVQQYTTYNAVGITVSVVGGIIGIVVLQKMLKFSATSLALIGCGSAVINALVSATAIYPWHLYFGTIVTFMRGITPAMYRSILSIAVPASDIGKVFSLAACFETTMPLFAGPLYTYIYSQTINTYPGAFNAVSTGAFFISFLLLAFVFAVEIRFPRITYGSLVR